MGEYVKVTENDDSIDLAFYIDYDEIMAIGEELAEINEDAYMNGYNWEALLNCYIEKNEPELVDTFETDSEGGMYAAYFEKSEQGRRNAEALKGVIMSLIEDKEKLFEFVRKNGEDIEWD